ncbi:MAG: chorismate mutase [Pelagibacteraceae bacterium TMED216]|nr:MAG: chorismate mutase [Pelagibacteraceae bacterium TMED216]|tara:strand:- start:89 stop:364 length:276 start_codon:yes stop_codon:yes gene_type:complete
MNKKLNKIRVKLDSLDNLMLNIIAKRTKLIDNVIKIKTYKKDIVDKSRIKKILSNIKKKSKSKKIDIILTKKIWSSMIKAYIDYEFRKFKK